MEEPRDQEAQQRVVHSQVRRIKQEDDEKVKVHETYQHQVSEMHLVLWDVVRPQRARSLLGHVERPAISIGGDS